MNDGYDVFHLETGEVAVHEDNLDDALGVLLLMEKEAPGVYWIRAVIA